ncbi:MAG: 50S ribosomal protein L1 [Candidatus Omnitrophica bacterium]|nr:50S ribosomal protein L1 [Candidatus Omnitrophota bacterium]
MAVLTKRKKEVEKLLDSNKTYGIEEAIAILKKVPHVRFDETVDINIKLGVNPKQSDQMVRGTVVLPHGTGKKKRILVFCKGEAAKFAKEAGADYVGDLDLIEKISLGWLEFDVAISTPEMMKEVGRLGKILGPRGLMPNPKTQTVTEDVRKAISDVKGGKVEFKMDKQANVHLGIGKLSFDEQRLAENVKVVIEAIGHSKPASLKTKFIKSMYLSSTMGPGIRLDLNQLKVD